jgi:very-short-patch-repair endonuclease
VNIEKFSRLGNDHRLFLRSEAIAAGLTDDQLANTSVFCRVLQGVYTLSGTPLTHELKCLAAAMKLPPDSVLTGLSAATLHGVPLAGFANPVEVIVTRKKGMHRRHGLHCTTVRTYDFEHSPWHDIRLAELPRVAFDILKRKSISYAVAYCDALLHSGLISFDGIAGFLAGRHDHGIVRARFRLPFLDCRAESIPESVLRVELALRGLHLTPQVQVFDGSEFIARVDLAFEAERIAVEYDGEWHAESAQTRRDAARRARLRSLGWIVIVVRNNDLRDNLDRVIASVQAAVDHRRNGSSSCNPSSAFG